jgi:hypothetical protein
VSFPCKMAEIVWLALRNDILRLQSLRTLLHFEFDLLSFIQRFITIGLNGGKMDEYILSRLALDKPIAFRSVKPLDRTLLFAHGIPLL